MDTLEGNKLIAEFIGFKVEKISPIEIIAGNQTYIRADHQSDDDFSCDWIWNLKCNPKNSGSFRFHTSWDWLMPVVEKISNLFDEKSDEWFGMCLDDDFPKIDSLKITESIKSVYDHVVQFIQWYNKQTSTNKSI